MKWRQEARAPEVLTWVDLVNTGATTDTASKETLRLAAQMIVSLNTGSVSYEPPPLLRVSSLLCSHRLSPNLPSFADVLAWFDQRWTACFLD